jgi:hypothetical protein
MWKNFLCLMVVLMGACVAFGQTAHVWTLVYVRSVTQNAGLSNTTLFTPSENGTYRMTATLSQKNVDNESSKWAAGLSWQDITSRSAAATLVVPVPGLGGGGNWNSASFMFTVKAGTPFVYSVMQEGQGPQTYHFAFTVEKLE